MGLVKTNSQGGALPRGYRLGKLGLGLVGSYLSYQVQNIFLGAAGRPQRKANFHKTASRQLREEMGAMKGPVMKLGQLLSMQNGVLPEEALQELASLQMQAPGMHASLACAQFKSALGKYPEEVFREFDSDPFAAASLGQVHRALTRRGEKVAVKIQYPGIKSAIENDLKLLRSAVLPAKLTGHVPAALLDEIQRGLLEETDYVHEADNLEFFRNGLSGLDYLAVPSPHRDLSTDRVLTMSYIEGEKLNDFLKRKPAQTLSNLVGARLVEIYETQIQWLKAVHADAHPGNFLFQPDGRIGLVDFGCVKGISFDVLELRRCYDERTWQESEAAARHFLTMVYGKGVPYARARKILPVLERFLDVVHPKNRTADLMIGNPDPKQEVKRKEIQREYLKQVLRDKLINPEFAFLGRSDMGLNHLLHELGAVVNYSEVLRRVAAARAL
jgi:hypothetical protein